MKLSFPPHQKNPHFSDSKICQLLRKNYLVIKINDFKVQIFWRRVFYVNKRLYLCKRCCFISRQRQGNVDLTRRLLSGSKRKVNSIKPSTCVTHLRHNVHDNIIRSRDLDIHCSMQTMLSAIPLLLKKPAAEQ